jgi:hypothetical protein
MSDYLCLLLTSNGCGHCSAFRGDGLINNGKAYMNTDYIKSLATIDKNPLKIINIHYENMSGLPQFISDISRFSITSSGVVQERYFKYENRARLRTILAKGKNNIDLKLGDVLEKNGKSIIWSDFIEKKLPRQISNYAFYFPCFMIVKKDNWKHALQSSNNNLVALTNAGFTIEKNGIVGIDKNSKTLQKRNVEIKKLILEVVKGQTKIEIHEKQDSETANQKKPEITKNPRNHNFVIKSYDE